MNEENGQGGPLAELMEETSIEALRAAHSRAAEIVRKTREQLWEQIETLQQLEYLLGYRKRAHPARPVGHILKAIIEAMARLGKPARPRDIAAEMERVGFVPTSSQPLNEFVSQMLYRARHRSNSPVERLESGLYRLVPEPEEKTEENP